MAQRYVLLTEGSTHPVPAKTAVAMLRYRREDVVALLDSQKWRRGKRPFGVPDEAWISGPLLPEVTSRILRGPAVQDGWLESHRTLTDRRNAAAPVVRGG